MEFVRTVGVKLAQENINSGRMASWSLLRTVYAGIGTEYNFIQVTNYNGPPPSELSPEARDQMYRKAIGMNYQDYQKKLTSFVTTGNSVLARIDASVDGTAPAVGSYIRVGRWKITSGRAADYANFIKTKAQPLNAEGVKEGVFQSWSATTVLYPSGADVSYDATTSSVYKDMAQVLAPPLANPNQGAPMAFLEIFPELQHILGRRSSTSSSGPAGTVESRGGGRSFSALILPTAFHSNQSIRVANGGDRSPPMIYPVEYYQLGSSAVGNFPACVVS